MQRTGVVVLLKTEGVGPTQPLFAWPTDSVPGLPAIPQKFFLAGFWVACDLLIGQPHFFFEATKALERAHGAALPLPRANRTTIAPTSGGRSVCVDVGPRLRASVWRCGAAFLCMFLRAGLFGGGRGGEDQMSGLAREERTGLARCPPGRGGGPGGFECVCFGFMKGRPVRPSRTSRAIRLRTSGSPPLDH